ncbi:adhesion G protein-coupled receptor E1-like isoform X2 [Scyliorhinus canicula]|uniref:adhesion G protein-coupled receptor E1-like isoform X2 n=1 Tax=Scyliorhinus canicula TaxID=7830 RepID=UPI0018F6973A|nr:adhesion G protein-coupled receptor E1-like isoform X2 [Scyliorhinus canicula]
MRIISYFAFLVFHCCYCVSGPASRKNQDCALGFKHHPVYLCVDINECDSSPCGQSMVCKNSVGTYACLCQEGFIATPGGAGKNTICQDVDECKKEALCGKNTTCQNSIGSYSCIYDAGFRPKPVTPESPLNCPNPEKRKNSTLVPCDPKRFKNLEQPNSWDNGSCSAMEVAHRFLDKVCQNFNVSKDSQAVTEFVNGLLNRSSELANMEVTQRLNTAAAILDLMENTAMAIALTLPHPGEQTISETSFALKIQVSGGQNESTDGLVVMQVWNNTMEINWRTVTGVNHSDFAAVSLLVFSNMESILNSEIRGESSGGAQKATHTVPLNSKVITATISNRAASDELSEVVNFTLKLNQGKNSNQKVECVYWKRTAVESIWSSEGCTVFGTNQTHVMCQCDHLTSFAILMAPVEIEDDFSMMVISTIGLIVSLLCLAASIVVFTKCRSIQNANTTVHKHLSVNLFLAQLLFLTGIHAGNKILCALIAGCLHYLFLTVFAWMLLDALQLFIACRHLTVKAFTHRHVIRRRYLYPSGYAVSALIVIISAAIRPSGYGSEKDCWLNLESGFRWSFQGPVCFVIVVNVVLFIWTMCLLQYHLSTRDVNVSKIKDTRTLTLKASARLFVVGCTWIFGIFNVNEYTTFLSYIFIVVNTLQGLFIFLVYCVFNQQPILTPFPEE